MPIVRSSFLEFLRKDAGARRREMQSELRDAIMRDEAQYLAAEMMAAERQRRPPLIENPSRDAVQRHIIAREKAWLDRDATEELLVAMERELPFGLYLRPYAAEGFEDVVLEVDGGFSINRSVEVSTVGRLHKRIQIYGLRNTLDLNTVARYRPVWIPPKFRGHWQQIVHDLAEQAKLIVINGTGKGTGFSHELREIPFQHPEKTWLLAGRDEQTGRYISSEVEDAVKALAGYEGHVSEPRISTKGELIYAEDFPQWVLALVEAYPPPAANSWARRLVSYLHRSMKATL